MSNTGTSCLGKSLNQHSWKNLEDLRQQTRHLGTWFSFGLVNVRFMTARVYSNLDDSMIP